MSAQQQLPPGVITQISSRTGKSYLFNTFTGESWYPEDRPSGYTGAGLSAQSAFSSSNSAVALSDGPPPAKRARLEDSGDAGAATQQTAESAVPLRDQAVSLAVAAAYDAHKDRGIHGRKESSILHLKNFNNWVKAVLISEFAPRSPRVLDLACGKCGDIQKWRIAGVERYCGVDISITGISDGAGRFNSVNTKPTSSGRYMEGKLARADLGVTNLKASGIVGTNESFDTISIQFALHYLFQSEHRALAFFRNIADCLAIGGVFLGTIPDAAYLVRRIRDTAMSSPSSASSSSSSSSGGAGGAVEKKPIISDGTEEKKGPVPTRFGNSIYYVDFEPETIERQWKIHNNPYSLGYTFFLAESVEHVKEYLVPWQLLERLAASCGLVPLANDNFHAFYRRMTGSSSTPMMTVTNASAGLVESYPTASSSASTLHETHKCVPLPISRTTILPPSPNANKNIQTLASMKVMDCEGTMSKEEWEAAGIYRVFAFKRVRTEAEAVAMGLPQLPSAAALFPKGLKKVDGRIEPVQSLADGSTRGTMGIEYSRSIQQEDIVDLFADVPVKKVPKWEGLGGGDDDDDEGELEFS
jgi:mRNA (guanine-N7-)-methyltransferase